jgi:hypothetical protein
MPTYVTREEFEALEQTRRNGDDLVTIKRQLDGVDLRGLAQKIGIMDAKLTSLVNSLPTVIAEALRKDRRERRKRT